MEPSQLNELMSKLGEAGKQFKLQAEAFQKEMKKFEGFKVENSKHALSLGEKCKSNQSGKLILIEFETEQEAKKYQDSL